MTITTANPFQPSVESNVPGIARSFLAAFRAARAARREPARLLAELSQCSAPELAAMNLPRAAIRHDVRSWQLT